MQKPENTIRGMTKEAILLQLLKKEQGFYRAILDLTRQESEMFRKRQDMESLSPLLKKKQALLSCIAEIETALTPLKKYWQAKKKGDDPQTHAIQKELDTLKDILRDVLTLDQANQRQMKEYIEKLKERRASLGNTSERAPL